MAEAEAKQDEFEAWKSGLYQYPGGTEDIQRVLYELDGTAWTTGIESDKKRRGSAINVLVTSESVWLGQRLAVVQVREATFHPKRFTRVRKDYYLCGRNETGTPFAHPIDATARDTVRKVLSRVWRCDIRDLDDIERNGDVAFVPVRKVPDLEPVEGAEPIVLAGSHRLTGKVYRSPKGTLYVRKSGRLEHAKGQHPTVRVREGLWRVQVATRAEGWGFSRPTAD